MGAFILLVGIRKESGRGAFGCAFRAIFLAKRQARGSMNGIGTARSLGLRCFLAIAFASQEFSRAGRALESGLYATPATDASCWLWLIVVISSVMHANRA